MGPQFSDGHIMPVPLVFSLLEPSDTQKKLHRNSHIVSYAHYKSAYLEISTSKIVEKSCRLEISTSKIFDISGMCFFLRFPHHSTQALPISQATAPRPRDVGVEAPQRLDAAGLVQLLKQGLLPRRCSAQVPKIAS